MTKQTSTVRIEPRSKSILQMLQTLEGRPQVRILADAIEQYRRNKIFEDASDAYSKLKKDKKAWSEELEERKSWERTIMDGLQE